MRMVFEVIEVDGEEGLCVKKASKAAYGGPQQLGVLRKPRWSGGMVVSAEDKLFRRQTELPVAGPDR